MEPWQRNVNYAAAGVLAAALVELAAGRGHGRAQTLGRVLSGGAVALAYANLVPRSAWGLRSAAAFAQLPLVRTLEAGLGHSRGPALAAATGLAGVALRLVR
jgi:hypothetical protein